MWYKFPVAALSSILVCLVSIMLYASSGLSFSYDGTRMGFVSADDGELQMRDSGDNTLSYVYGEDGFAAITYATQTFIATPQSGGGIELIFSDGSRLSLSGRRYTTSRNSVGGVMLGNTLLSAIQRNDWELYECVSAVNDHYHRVYDDGRRWFAFALGCIIALSGAALFSLSHALTARLSGILLMASSAVIPILLLI